MKCADELSVWKQVKIDDMTTSVNCKADDVDWANKGKKWV